MNICPHCRRRVIYEPGAVMCEWCAEAISTDEIFDMLTFKGRVPDSFVALYPWLLGGVVFIVMLIALTFGEVVR